jgi:hypothetical protein
VPIAARLSRSLRDRSIPRPLVPFMRLAAPFARASPLREAVPPTLPAMSNPSPLSIVAERPHGPPPLWARPVWARLSPSTRRQVEGLDRFLHSAAGLTAGVALSCLFAGSMLLLQAQGSSWLAASVIAAVLTVGLAASLAAGWLLPDRYTGRKLWTIALMMMVASYAGVFGTMFGRATFAGRAPADWPQALLAAVWQATPFQLIAGLAMVLAAWGASASRRQHLQRELVRLRLEQERDSAAAQLTQARLSLLQAQIQPHFLFNTLAALQHWVDGGDPRAAPLLRRLTAFLRGATELMLRDTVTLAQESDMAGHYLSIMESRLGERLRSTISVAPDCAGQLLPPGLLITLVENAVEHGIEPQLRGGTVQVIASRDAGGVFELRVLDDGAGLPAGAGPVDGVGLANSRERLRHRFGERAQLQLAPRTDGPGTEVRLRIAPEGAM